MTLEQFSSLKPGDKVISLITLGLLTIVQRLPTPSPMFVARRDDTMLLINNPAVFNLYDPLTNPSLGTTNPPRSNVC